MLIRLNLKKKISNPFKIGPSANTVLILVGDFITVGFKITENTKTRMHEYSGVVIAKKNKNLNATLSIRSKRKVTYTFFINSPDMLFLKIHYSLNLTRSKLYYLKKIK